MCNAEITGQGNGKITNIDGSNVCHPVAEMEHESGCFIFTANPLTRWLDSNPWFLAVFCLVVGVVTAFLGKKFFPVVAAIISFFATEIAISVLSAEMGWMEKSWSPWVVLVIAVILGIAAAMIVHKTIWIAVGLAGIVAGFFLGMFLFSLMAASTNHAKHWEMIVFGVALAIVGGVLAFKWGKEMLVISTAFIGSYIFMRGWTFIFDGYPSEGEMWSDMTEGQEFEITSNFWIFVVVWLVTFIVGLIIQWKALENDKRVDEHYQKS